MHKLFPAFTAVAVALLAAGAAHAQNLDYSTGTLDNAYQMFSPGTGQTFTVPAGVDRITSVTLGVTTQSSTVQSYDLQLYAITGNTLGALVQSSAQTIDAASQYPIQELDTMTLNGGGFAVVPGQTYAIIGANSSSVQNTYVSFRASDVYPGGAYYNGGVVQPSAEGFFKVSFAAAAQPVPTLSEWAMILFGTFLAGGAALYIQRRRFTV